MLCADRQAGGVPQEGDAAGGAAAKVGLHHAPRPTAPRTPEPSQASAHCLPGRSPKKGPYFSEAVRAEVRWAARRRRGEKIQQRGVVSQGGALSCDSQATGGAGEQSQRPSWRGAAPPPPGWPQPGPFPGMAVMGDEHRLPSLHGPHGQGRRCCGTRLNTQKPSVVRHVHVKAMAPGSGGAAVRPAVCAGAGALWLGCSRSWARGSCSALAHLPPSQPAFRGAPQPVLGTEVLPEACGKQHGRPCGLSPTGPLGRGSE